MSYDPVMADLAKKLQMAEGLLKRLLDEHVEYESAEVINGNPYPANLRGYDPHGSLNLTREEDAYVCALTGRKQTLRVFNTERKPGPDEVLGSDGIIRRKKPWR